MKDKQNNINTLQSVKLSYLLISALFLMVAAPYLTATVPQGKTGGFEHLIKVLDKIQSQQRIPAYAVVITSPDQILLDKVRGTSHSGSSEPVSDNAYFRIGSITKTVISLSALVAEKQGKLKLSDRVTDYLGNYLFDNPHKENHPVTLEQLLEHSAGFADMSRKEFTSNDEVTLQQGLERFAKDRTTLWSPGLYHSYSNTGFGLAGRVLEIATKSEINEWLTTAIFNPLGMKTATMKHSKTVSLLLVPGYQSNGNERIPYWNMIYPSLGAINLQPRDMGKLLQFYLKQGAGYLPRKLVQRQETPKTTLAAKQGLAYGYGLGLYQWYRNGHLFYGHGGDADGYLAHFGYQKEAKRGYFIVINTFNARAKNEMKKVIEKFIVGNLPEPIKSEEINNQDLDFLAGQYYPVTGRFKSRRDKSPLLLKWRSKRLFIKEPGRSWDPLIYVGHGLFRRTYETNATAAIFSSNGTVWFQGDEGNFVRQALKP